MENPLVIARAGTLKHLDDYFEKSKSSDKVGNWYRLGEIDFRQPQAACSSSTIPVTVSAAAAVSAVVVRFVGVAPEVCEQSEVDLRTQRSGGQRRPSARKKKESQ